MVNCPFCNEEIHYLSSSQESVTYASVSLNHRGEYLDFEDSETEANGEIKFYCRNCGKLLFSDEEEALQFLKGSNNNSEKEGIEII